MLGAFMKRTLLTEEQFRLLQTTVAWLIDAVPKQHWNKIPGLERLQDTFGIMASGCYNKGKLAPLGNRTNRENSTRLLQPEHFPAGR